MLDKLARLRRLEVAQAKRDLASALTAEAAARRALTQAQAAVAREARIATPAVPGAFAAWLPAAADAIARCQNAQTEAAQTRDAARSALAVSRATLKATETLQETRAAEARLQAERRAERTLSDASQGLKT
jgi:flagellar biosynthesis chaperone FliJ